MPFSFSRLIQFSLGTAVALTWIGGTPNAFAWGERGHHLICEVATRLVQDQDLRRWLLSRGDKMGHICNIPDIYWRDLGPSSKSGDAGHFMNPENLGVKPDGLSTDFKENAEEARKKGLDPNEAFGSMWWRADQFMRLAIQSGQLAKKSAFPDQNQGQDHDQPYNKGIYGMMVNMGLAGHFVGDASQPFHNTANYDGWANGHGGLHSYFEDQMVVNQPFDLIQKVFEAASKMMKEQNSSSSFSLIDEMKKLSTISSSEIAKIEALDPIITPSQVNPDGTKVKAKRQYADQAAPKFEDLIVEELARSVVLLARTWDNVYQQSGKPDLWHYRSYQYALQPDFVAPDYLVPVSASPKPNAKPQVAGEKPASTSHDCEQHLS